MLGVLAELEREMTIERVRAELERVKYEISTNGHYIAKGSGKRRNRLGRPM
jgi:DNA invertase Pin-like site-specific DNA recombinase